MDWEDALARTDAAASAVFDTQTFQVQPRKPGLSVNARPVDDLVRSEFEFAGTIEFHAPDIARASRMSADPGSRESAVRFEAVISALVAGWPYIPARGDLIAHGTDRYVIVNTDQDGTDRRVFYVNRGE